jgi:hypothetical protein
MNGNYLFCRLLHDCHAPMVPNCGSHGVGLTYNTTSSVILLEKLSNHSEHFPGTVTDFTACSLPSPLAFTFDLLPKSDNVVLFYFIYLHVSKSHLHVSKSLLFTSPSSRPLFMYLTHVPSCFGTISSKKMLLAVFMLLSHLTFNF